MKTLVNSVLGLAGLRMVRTGTIEQAVEAARAARADANDLRVQLAARPKNALLIYGHLIQYDPLDAGMDLSPLHGQDAPTGGEQEFILRACRYGQTAIDIGANVGLSSLLMAKAVGAGGKVFAFEPGPRAVRFLRMNVGLNAYRNITIEHCAISDVIGSTELQVCLTGESDNRLEGVVADDVGYIRMPIKTTTIDDYMRGRPADIIKMDIQGSEFAALKGMRETISRNPSLQIVMEYGPGWLDAAGVTPRDFFDLIEGFGLIMYDLPESGPEQEVNRDWLAANIGAADRGQTNLILRRK
jgi:FkbM family methyltransferase